MSDISLLDDDFYDARVDVEHVDLYQADCVQCGWHTRQSPQKSFIERLARWHRKNCPNPKPPRNGGLLMCGCWVDLMPGSSVAPDPVHPTTNWHRAICPNGHNEQAIIQCNISDPDYPYGKAR